jgi:peptidyl-prolyl cis-trans isomerase D
VKVSDEEIDQYYQTHSQQFTRPEQFKIAYVELAAKQIKDSIDVSDEEAQTYYQDNIASYSSQAQRDLSHILFKAEDKATAQEVLAKLKAGEDFAALAKEYSQDPGSATQGGELGWVEKGVMDPDFETAAFSLAQPGDVSDVVESSFGLHIIKLNAEKAAQAKPFSDVKAEVIAKIQDQKAVDKFYELQSELEKVAFESPDSLDASAKAISGEIHSTDFISLGELPALLDNTQVRNALENAEVKEDRLNSSVLNLGPEDVVVVRINDSRPETLLPLADVRDDVIAALTEQKAQAAAQALAEKIVESLKKGDDTILAAHQLSFSESEIVQRNAPSAASIFAMPKPVDGKPVYAQIEGLTGETEVVQLIKVDTQANDNLNTQIAMQLQRVNQQKDTQGVLSILRKNADIKYYISDTN